MLLWFQWSGSLLSTGVPFLKVSWACQAVETGTNLQNQEPEALPEGKEKDFYVAIAKSEEKHKNLFVELAYEYFDKEEVDVRLEELLVAEAEICKNIPFTAALH